MKQKRRTTNTLMALCGLMLGLGGTASGAGKGPALPNPDFTHGGKPDDSHDWTLGATGARGWIYAEKGQTAPARQILVTEVAKSSPADGAPSSCRR